MTLTIELTDDEASRLDRISNGRDIAATVHQLIASQLPTLERFAYPKVSAEEFDAVMEELCSDIDPAIPPVPIDRESFYPDPMR